MRTASDADGDVLVVDDNEMNRDMLSRRLKRLGYRVATAPGGQEALDLVERQPFDLVLLDVMMPGINGFEVLQRIRQTRSASDLPIIMATAKDQSEDIVQALKLGANDYVTKPLDFPVVLARVQTQLSLKRAMEELARANQVITSANMRMKRALDAAARIQRALLPAKLPEVAGASFAWIFRPCDELGGDILNIFELDASHVGLYVLDVSGHGVASALLSVTVSRFLSPILDASSLLKQPAEGGAGYRIVPPAQVADQLNRRFQWDPETRQFFTLMYGLLNLSTRELRYVSAGHPGPVHVSPAGEPTLVQVAGSLVGLADAPYDEQLLVLEPGQRVYFYTDGIVEARNPGGQAFGSERLLATLAQASKESLADSLAILNQAIEAWTAGKISDDVSLLGLEITG